LAAKLTGWRIDITSAKGEGIASADVAGNTEVHEEKAVEA
jgi:hypothetical protein